MRARVSYSLHTQTAKIAFWMAELCNVQAKIHVFGAIV